MHDFLWCQKPLLQLMLLAFDFFELKNQFRALFYLEGNLVRIGLQLNLPKSEDASKYD